MKTLHLTNSWHPASGGVGTFYRALFEAANRERHYMRLVVPGTSTGIEDVSEFGRIYTIEAPRAPLNRDYRMVLPHRYLFPLTALQRIVNRELPDLIEISDKYAMHYMGGLMRTRRLPGVRLRPTIVGTSHERMDENFAAYVAPAAWGQSLCKRYMKWLYFPMFDHHIAVSEHVAVELIRASRGHRVRRGIWIVPMGVDCERFTPKRRSPALRRRLLDLVKGAEDSKILLYVGRLAPEKNLSLLIDTMAKLDPVRYRMAIVGSGMLLEPLRRECAARGLTNVALWGYIADRDALADCYANADIFLHPNPREPFGIAPLEAMASGLALVAPNTGGVTSYANASNAWLTDAVPEAFAETVGAVNRSKAVAARETAEQFAWPAIAAHCLRLYRQLHAVARGAEVSGSIAARTYSTDGDLFGRELIKL